jgi:hypothetical protein
MSEAGTQQMASDGSPATAGRSFAQRFVGALRLDGSVYEEVANDAGAIGQAAGVAVAAAVARVIGVYSATTSGEAVFGGVSVLAFWPVAAFLVWAVGNLLKSPADLGRVLRVVGFAMAPLILVALLLVPNDWFRAGVLLVTYALLFAAFVVGMRQALRVDSGRAAFVCIIVAMMFFLIYSIALYAVYGTGGAS